MGCPCTNPETGEIVDIPAKTKEMVYRTNMPQFKDIIKAEMEKTKHIKYESGGGKK